MIVGADWLITGIGSPQRRGGVRVHGSQVVEVGDFDAMAAASPAEPTEFFAGCVASPGLVNAHTHLSLTVLGGLVPTDGRFSRWLRSVTAGVLAMRDDDFAASTSLGACESLASGVTAVGDIAYGPEALAAAADSGLGGTFYWEVLGLEAADLSGELAEREFPTSVGACTTGRTRCGISPHAPYSSGPRLLTAAHAVSRAHGVGFAIHVAESEAETALLRDGSGPFAGTAARLAPDFTVPGVSPVAYLSQLGVLDNALAIHCVNLEPGDAALLKGRARAVAVCPRSNAFLGNGRPPISELAGVGVPLAVGTDSSASSPDLDLLAELRVVRGLGPTLTARRLLRMVTTDGARAIGVDDVLGSLEPGKQADIALFSLGEGVADPESELVLRGGRATVRSVMTGGVWRVREGRACFPTALIERAAARARETARRAIAGA